MSLKKVILPAVALLFLGSLDSTRADLIYDNGWYDPDVYGNYNVVT